MKDLHTEDGIYEEVEAKEFLNLLPRKVTNEDNIWLNRAIMEEEI